MILTVPVQVDDPAAGTSSTAEASASVRVPFGVNLTAYAAVSPSLDGLTWVKVFADSSGNGVPVKWPGNPANPVPAGATALVCFDPDPAMTLAGTLKSQLSAYIEQAPEGSWLTGWQEANRPGGPYQSLSGSSAAQLTDLHGYLHNLVQQVNPGVLYGECISTSPVRAGQDVTPWICPGLGWYSMDGYDPDGNSTPEAVFGQAWQDILTVAPDARPAISETNSIDPTGGWFTSCWDWLTSRNGTLIATFWGQGGEGSQHEYVFPPPAAALAALQSVGAQCSA